MAVDLAGTPTAGLEVQLCGDAHLSNFGAFASPERRLLFDLNDFDETLPGPFEYDVKRLAASFTIALGPTASAQPRRGRRRWRPRRPIGGRWPGSARWACWTSGMPTWIPFGLAEHAAAALVQDPAAAGVDDQQSNLAEVPAIGPAGALGAVGFFVGRLGEFPEQQFRVPVKGADALVEGFAASSAGARLPRC